MTSFPSSGYIWLYKAVVIAAFYFPDLYQRVVLVVVEEVIRSLPLPGIE